MALWKETWSCAMLPSTSILAAFSIGWCDKLVAPCPLDVAAAVTVLVVNVITIAAAGCCCCHSYDLTIRTYGHHHHVTVVTTFSNEYDTIIAPRLSPSIDIISLRMAESLFMGVAATVAASHSYCCLWASTLLPLDLLFLARQIAVLACGGWCCHHYCS